MKNWSGEALKPFRDEVVISTKFGISFSEYTHGDIIPDARPEKIRQSVEGSLKRLQTETIDLYFQHRIDPKVEPEVVAEVMGELIKEGKIRHWGRVRGAGRIHPPCTQSHADQCGSGSLFHDGQRN